MLQEKKALPNFGEPLIQRTINLDLARDLAWGFIASIRSEPPDNATKSLVLDLPLKEGLSLIDKLGETIKSMSKCGSAILYLVSYYFLNASESKIGRLTRERRRYPKYK